MFLRMNKFFSTIVCFLFVLASHAQFTDDFSDGDFTNNPTWSGNDALFVIDAGQLRSNTGTIASAATYYLSTPSTLANDAEWEFFINLKFATSGANYVDVYLMADNANLSLANNGYFVRIGNTADEISLYKRVGGTNTMIINGVDGLVNSSTNNPFKIKVTREASNTWTLMHDKGVTGMYTTEGVVVDSDVNTSSHFGILIVQSTAASVVNNHFFDDFVVQNIPIDDVPPTIVSVSIISSNELDVLFDEPVSIATAENENNYAVNNGIGQPATAVRDGANNRLVHLNFAVPFTSGQNNIISVQAVEDLAGNAMAIQNIPFTYYETEPATFRDIVFNELLPDPSPVVGLPEQEFVELYNRSDKFIDLAGLKFIDPSATATLSSHILSPGEYIILCRTQDVVLFEPFGTVMGLSPWPTLNNASDSLWLRDAANNIIDFVFYRDTWYQNSTKRNGGWSLELIDPISPCSGATNWIASNDPSGGTPGRINSVFDDSEDDIPPRITSTEVVDEFNVTVYFSEPVLVNDLQLTDVSITGGIEVVSIAAANTENTAIHLSFDLALDTGVVYVISISNLSDCSGNITTAQANIVLPFAAQVGDIIINEILFNPFTGGSDFVELYNNSNKILTLKGVSMANEGSDGLVTNLRIISTPRLFYPKEHVVISNDTTHVKENYPASVAGQFVQSSLPTYANASGVVNVVLPNGNVSDRFAYTEKMHFRLIRDKKGKSLERIDYNRPTDDETNWHTAAETVGFATPGRENSQYADTDIDGEISLYPPIFSPDNDGYEDVITFSYSFSKEGFVGNAYVYDSEGRMVRYLLQNQLLGTEGAFSWDGITDRGDKGRIGAYIFVFEVFNLEGNVNVFKKSFVLGGRL
jgi:hypothetical protein